MLTVYVFTAHQIPYILPQRAFRFLFEMWAAVIFPVLTICQQSGDIFKLFSTGYITCTTSPSQKPMYVFSSTSILCPPLDNCSAESAHQLTIRTRSIVIARKTPWLSCDPGYQTKKILVCESPRRIDVFRNSNKALSAEHIENLTHSPRYPFRSVFEPKRDLASPCRDDASLQLVYLFTGSLDVSKAVCIRV